MKKTGIALIAALCLLALAGCGRKNEAPSTPSIGETAMESRSMSETMPSSQFPSQTAADYSTDNLGNDLMNRGSEALDDASRALDDVVTGTDTTRGR